MADLEVILEEASDAYSNGDLEVAARLYDRVLEADPDCIEALEWRGEIAIQQDDYECAAEMLQRAHDLDPESFKEFCNLGLAYYELDMPVESVSALRAAIALNPDDMVSHSNLGKALGELVRAGHVEEAKRYALEWRSQFPDVPDARHLGAAVAGINADDRASDAFVAETFDDFADTFESKLEELSYKAPRLVSLELEKRIGGGRVLDDLLDAGCGTGLCGPYLRPMAKRLVGVDLSPKMLAKAWEKDCYDDLEKVELTAYLSEHREAFDAIVAADVFCYFGAMDAAASMALHALRPGGIFIFSVEGAFDEGDQAFNLKPSGRYTHRKDYLLEVVEGAGFAEISVTTEMLRTEYAEPVDGFLVSAVRP